jgi:hypothetical protein
MLQDANVICHLIAICHIHIELSSEILSASRPLEVSCWACVAGWMDKSHRRKLLQEVDDTRLLSFLHEWIQEEANSEENDYAFAPGPKALGEKLYGDAQN